MTTISFNADYAHILTKQGFVSTEETRYYLRGVFVHPCRNQPGAFLVATDGHRLGIFYDAEAVAPVPAIVRLSPDALRMTKPHKTERRTLRVDVTKTYGEERDGASAVSGTVTLHRTDDDALLCGLAGEVIDGTFPDYQRVVPAWSEGTQPADVVGYNVAHLASFDFRNPYWGRGAPIISITQTDGSAPARVLNSHYQNFMGVQMPKEVPQTAADFTPEWYFDRPVPAAAAAE